MGTVIVGLTNVLATFIAIVLLAAGDVNNANAGLLVMAAGMGVLSTMMHIGIRIKCNSISYRMLLVFIVPVLP